MYLHKHPNDFSDLIEGTNESFDIERKYIAKDYFIFMLLKEISSRNPLIVFKGGTCLSKCHRVIERFSEDVDLGMEASHVTESPRRKMKRDMVASAEALGLHISNLDETRSRRVFNKYLVPFEAPSLASDTIIAETAIITSSSPAESGEVGSFIYDYCIQNGLERVVDFYGLEPFTMPIISLERTFVDKVFAVCDYVMGNATPDRNSRHVYDLHCLISRVSLDVEMKELFSRVRGERENNPRCCSAQNGIVLSKEFSAVLTSDAYKEDYERVTLPLLFTDVLYKDAINSLFPIVDFLETIESN